jgi:hypothetical protein
MGRELISKRINAFVGKRCRFQTLCGISHPLEWLSPTLRQIVHALLTRSPLTLRCARLACMRHAISVRSEPGSNSPYDLWLADYCLCSKLCIFRRLLQSGLSPRLAGSSGVSSSNTGRTIEPFSAASLITKVANHFGKVLSAFSLLSSTVKVPTTARVTAGLKRAKRVSNGRAKLKAKNATVNGSFSKK